MNRVKITGIHRRDAHYDDREKIIGAIGRMKDDYPSSVITRTLGKGYVTGHFYGETKPDGSSYNGSEHYIFLAVKVEVLDG